jgi:hypothetical protein
MAWLLQPHDYRQVLIPNYYRVDYGRVGAYKGMGRLGQGTDYSNVDPNTGLTVINPSAPANTGQFATGVRWDPNVYSEPLYSQPPASQGQTFGQWMQANSGIVAIGAVLLFAIVATGRR